MTITQERVSLEQLGLLMSLDVCCYLNPKSVGLEALEANLMNGTSISTEGLVERIKERGAKILERAKTYLSKITAFISEKRYYVTGAVALIAVFAGGMFVLTRDKDKTPTASDAHKEGSKVREAIEKRKEKFKEAVKHIREKFKGDKAKQDEEIEKLSESSEKVSSHLGKIKSAAEKAYTTIVKSLKDLPNLLKRKKEEEKKAPAALSYSKEGFIGDLGRSISNGIAYAVYLVTMIVTLSLLLAVAQNPRKYKAKAENKFYKVRYRIKNRKRK